MKQYMWEAARETRNELQRLPLTSNDTNACEARFVTLRAIARAVWRQDLRTGATLMATTEFGARFLALSSSSLLSLLEPDAFRDLFREMSAAALERRRSQAAALAQRANAAGQAQTAAEARRQQRAIQK
eukprot:6802825-Pyramimonas_sp.AAC.1